MPPLALVLAVSLLASLAAASSSHDPAAVGMSRAPTVFVANRGQQPEPVRFCCRAPGLTAWFTDRGARLVLENESGIRAAVFLALESALESAPARAGCMPGAADRRACAPAGTVRPRGVGEPAGHVNVYRGRDRSTWVHAAPAYRRLRYEQAAPGVDLVFGERDGRLSYDLQLAPGAALDSLALCCEGADALSLDGQGRLVLGTAAGPLVQTPPVAWQLDAAGEQVSVEVRFRLLGPDRWGFEVPGRDASRSLVIDPGLTWGSHLGGSLNDEAHAVALTPQGHVVLVGTTGSPDFPVTPGAVQRGITGFNDAFVARIDPSDGQLVFATYLGGNDGVIFRPDVAEDVAVGADGSLVLVGTAASPDFPTTAGAFTENSAGGTDAFVARLDAGGALVWSTLLSGAGNDEALALALADDGVVTAVGLTFSNDFPTTAGAFAESFGSVLFTDDGWVARLAADGSCLQWSSFLGGSVRDELADVALDAAGRPVVVGLSGSTDFPATPGALDQSFNGDSTNETDAVLARFSADGSTLEWATYLGGSDLVEGNGLALAGNGDVVVVGETHGGGFPLSPDALQSVYGGGSRDGFVCRLTADGSSLAWSTLLGGARSDRLSAVALNSGEQATIVGTSDSPALLLGYLPDLIGAPGTGGSSSTNLSSAGSASTPSVGAGSAGSPSSLPFDVTPNGLEDALLARLDVDGQRLIWASFHGGSGLDSGLDLALEPGGAAWIAGRSDSGDLPLAGTPTQAEAQGSGDAYLARFAIPPLSFLGLAAGVPGRDAPRLLGLGAFEPGRQWRLELSGASARARGWLLLGDPASRTPIEGRVLAPSLVLPIRADASGGWSLSGAAWPLPHGTRIVAQALFPGPVTTRGLLIQTP